MGDDEPTTAELLHDLNNALFGIQLALDGAMLRLGRLTQEAEREALEGLVRTSLNAAEKATGLVAQLGGRA